MSGEWSEQYIAEMISILGFAVETNCGLHGTGTGGKNEADVIGWRVHDSNVFLVHVEVGHLTGSFKTNVEHVQKKFTTEMRASVKEFVKYRTNPTNANWHCLWVYVHPFARKNETIDRMKSELLPEDIHYISLDHLIPADGERAILIWKKYRMDDGFVKTKDIHYTALPSRYRLLKVIEYAMIVRVQSGEKVALDDLMVNREDSLVKLIKYMDI